MLSRLPVLAANTGGPVETVVDGQTGWLRGPEDVDAWRDVMVSALSMSPAELARIGEAGRRRVRDTFGRSKMAENFDDTLRTIITQSQAGIGRGATVLYLNIGVFLALGLGVSVWYILA